MKKIINVILAGCLLVACSQDDYTFNAGAAGETPIVENHRVSVEQAKVNALDFVSNIQSRTRSDNYKSLEVENVQAISFPKTETRSEGDSINLDSLLYIVNFADSCGFVIAGTDDRENSIYAYIEDGNFSWEDIDSINNGFKAFLYKLLEHKSNYCYANVVNPGDLENNGGSGGQGYLPDKFEVMYPLLKTKWGQYTPYNTYTPDHDPTGCVVTAVSQICSYLELPNSVDWTYNNTSGSATMNWTQINSECEAHFGKLWSNNCKEQVAQLMRYWGLAFHADYGSDRTGVDPDDAISLLKNYGFSISGFHDYNSGDVIDDLKVGNRIVLMTGFERYYHIWLFIREYVGGHAWVVDGYIDEVKKGEESYYIHCNWGWDGGSNGYYLCNVLDPDNGYVYNDSATRSGYQYNMKFATFFK